MIKTAVYPSRRLVACGIICVLSLAGAAPASAQGPDRTPTPAEAVHRMDALQWKKLSLQLALSLDSPVAQIRQEAMQQINFFAANYSDRIDLTRALPGLIRIYDTDATEGYRIMALTALHAIGDRSAMAYLRERVRWETSPRVRHLTLAALADYDQRTQAL